MCGIAAVIDSGTDETPSETCGRLIAALRHRGDREPRMFRLPGAALACARLALVDPPSGTQPCVSPDGRSVLVFNGEIYNHRALRRELEALGHRFVSDCDTEVVLHGCLQWGESVVEHLEGMYAFVFYDTTTRDFFAIRDRFGIKPLHYACEQTAAGKRWLMASEIGALRKASVAAEQIEELPPGGILNRRGSSSQLPATETHYLSLALDEALILAREKIRHSVRSMLDTHHRVALLLSGGIDSSILLYEAAHYLDSHDRLDQLSAYCVTTEANSLWHDGSDAWHADLVANNLGVPLEFVVIEEIEMVDSIPEVVATIESFEPNHLRAGTAHLALARKLQRDNIKIAICGEGADELWGGYEEFPDCAARAGHGPQLEALFSRFASELYRTQLRRVDRVMMSCGIEARVPYLDDKLAAWTLSLPSSLKLPVDDHGRPRSKGLLRDAYRDLLPAEIVDRRKVPMGEGAGIGDNAPGGPFHDEAERRISQDELIECQRQHPEFAIRTKEEAWYFQIFLTQFGKLPAATQRPLTNLLPTRAPAPARTSPSSSGV